MTIKEGIPPCLIHIDKEGQWFHKGVEMVRREFVRSFYKQMEMDDAGRYLIRQNADLCYVDVEDTAFVVRRVSATSKGSDKGAGFILNLSDDAEEELMPDTLYLGEKNILYCKVKDRTFPARFNRAAYYQLASHIEAEGNDYVLPINGRKFKIASVPHKGGRCL